MVKRNIGSTEEVLVDFKENVLRLAKLLRTCESENEKRWKERKEAVSS